ncbi:unnamed protein product [Effrenium voratum]|nr:unnamed protein product [Effrenium voratum]
MAHESERIVFVVTTLVLEELAHQAKDPGESRRVEVLRSDVNSTLNTCHRTGKPTIMLWMAAP